MNKKNKALTAMLTLGLTTGLASAPIMAEEKADDSKFLTKENGMVTSKKATLEDDGTYTIDIEAYAEGTTTIKQETEGQPLDIVLVLDRSGSMNDNGKLASLKTAVNNFIDNVKNDAVKGNVTHKIALVGFAGSAGSFNAGHTNTGIYTNKQWKSYYKDHSTKSGNLTNSDYQKAFMDSTQDYSTLTQSVNSLTASGATRIDLGLEMANNIFKNNPIRTEQGKTAKRVTVVFTDGQPAYSSWSDTIANDAINNSKTTKNTYESDVYSVGVFSSSDSNSTKVNNFMKRLSSASKDATKYTNGTVDSTLVDKYYFKATDPTKLSAIFETIFKDIVDPTTPVTLTSESYIRDIISKDFTLPEGYKPEDSITIKTVSGSKANAEADPVWGSETGTANNMSVSVTGDTIDVTGFDYSTKFIAPQHNGEKVVLQIKGVIPKDEGFQNKEVSTNGEMSGVYAKDAETPVIKFYQPKTILTEKAYVVDYAKKIEVNTNGLSIGKVNNIVGKLGSVNGTDNGVNPMFGSFAIEGLNAISYTPQSMKWDGVDRLYAFGKAEANSTAASADGNLSNNLWGRVSVLPANSVYYEDTFTSANGATVGIEYLNDGTDWSSVGTSGSDSYNTDTTHGAWQDAGTGDSDGMSHLADASKGAATATFNFTGTGVDIYSRTNAQTGTIYVTVENTKEAQPKKRFIIDTKSASGEYYNIPTFSLHNLDHSDYKVTLKVTDAASKEGRTMYYLSGIRIYNPLGDGAAADGYADAYNGEFHSTFHSVKDLISADSVVFIDEVPGETEEDTKTAQTGRNDSAHSPMNEVYLAGGHSAVISTGNVNGESADKFYIGLKSPDGKPTNITINGRQVTVTSSMDLYYPVTPVNGAITIKNEHPADDTTFVSVTKLRTAYDSYKGDVQPYSVAAISDEDALACYNLAMNVEEPTYSEEPKTENDLNDLDTDKDETVSEETVEDLDASNVEIENPDKDVVESKPNNWWNKLFGGFNRLFR